MKNEHELIIKYAQGRKTVLPKSSLIDLLQHSFKKHADRKAIVFHGSGVSYQELDFKSNAVRDILQKQAVSKGDMVLVEVENSIELVLCLVGILKLGAVYIPVDSSWPLKRKKEIESIVKPKITLIKIGENYKRNIYKNEFVIDYCALPCVQKNIYSRMSSQDAAYGFFTSGSTGAPKCALNTHIGLLNRLWYMNHRYGCSIEDVILLNSKHIFDASLWQMLWPLINGALLVIPYENENFVPSELAGLFERYGVTVTDFVPSVFSYFVKFLRGKNYQFKFKNLRQILIGGEEMNLKDVTCFKKMFPYVGITNTYGPTECSIGTIFYEVPKHVPEAIPIGRPIDNVCVIILKTNMDPATIGEIGEIYLGGVCVGLGYVGSKKNTDCVFLKNPFRELHCSKLYKTGDLGVLLLNGDIQYKGRTDQQIKIQGVRVELGEIERVIKKNSYVDNAIVCFEDIGNHRKELLLFATVKKRGISKRAMHLWCKKYLPFNLIPNHIKIVKNMPLTDSGKINRKKIKFNIMK